MAQNIQDDYSENKSLDFIELSIDNPVLVLSLNIRCEGCYVKDYHHSKRILMLS